MLDLPERLAAHLFVTAQRVAAGVRASGLRCEAIHLALADGHAAGQEVFHVHLHVNPQFEGDYRRQIIASLERFRVRPPREELDHLAAQIRDGWERSPRRRKPASS